MIVQATKHNQSSLEREYLRWTYVQRMQNTLYKHCKNIRDQYEALNILERWILSSVNFAQSHKQTDEVLTDKILMTSHPINQKLEEELVLKGLADQKNANLILFSLHELVEQFLEEQAILPLNLDQPRFRILDNGRIYYKNYRHKISSNRLKLLRQKGTDKQIAIMLLRYASILSRSQHWNIPLANYKWLHNYYNIDIEGFASPVNAQLLAIDSESKFCSLFPDTDCIFGSIGNFFSADFLGHSVYVNPPYIEDIMDQVSQKLNEQCKLADSQGQFVRFFVTIAAWRDSKGFLQMSKSKYCTYQEILTKHTHFYEDSNQDGKAIISRFDTAFFVLENNINYDSVDYSKSLDKMHLGKNQKLSP